MNAPSLTGFLEMTEARYRLFDLGTQLKKLPGHTLKSLDSGQPYPHPHLGYGWLVIFMWNEQQTEQNSLWFLKLPLDEQGILPAAVHSDLVNRLYKALQTSDAKERQRLLTDHPYQFTPEAEKMAALHANATQLLGLPASDYLPAAERFYLHRQSAVDWTTLGLQGIADLVCRADDDQLIRMTKALTQFDTQPQTALLRQLEHRSLPTSAVETLVDVARSHSDDEHLTVAAMRAAANSPAFRLMEGVIRAGLEQEQPSLEVILTVTTRYHALFDDKELTVTTLDRLARISDADGFARVITNLAMQPGLNGIVMRTLGSSELTEALGLALGRLIQRQRGQHGQH